MLTGRAFIDETATAVSDDDDPTAAAVAAMKKGGSGHRRRKSGGRSSAIPTADRLSLRRAGSGGNPLLGPQPQQEGGNVDGDEESSSNPSLLERAEVDAILSEAASASGGAGAKSDAHLDDAAAVAAAVREGGGESYETEVADGLRALMGEIGFGEEEVAAYSLEELLLLREELEKEWAAAETEEASPSLEAEKRGEELRRAGSAVKQEEVEQEEEEQQEDQEKEDRDAEPPWEHHSLSLQERLGLSDEEVEKLRRSPRSGLALSGGIIGSDSGGAAADAFPGLDVDGGRGGTVDGVKVSPGSGVVDYGREAAAAAAAASRMKERMTGRSAGGPQTAVGYLLGELRMRPEEVKDAVLRWPALMSLSKRGPHAVASWLQGGLGLSADDVGKMIRKNPAIVACSIVHNLRPKLR
ncbi:unnamed protein product, partial [Ectocarpus fasciculatus]